MASSPTIEEICFVLLHHCSSSNFVPHSFTTPITLKLDDENYLLWKQRVLATIRGLKFQQFLEDNSVPLQFVTINGTDIEYEDYIQHDQLIMAWLLASMHPAILTQMVGLDSSAIIWAKLQTYHISQIRARVEKLKFQLKTPKRDMSVSVFLLDIKKTVDTLVVVDSPITTEDHIDAMLDDLPDEYDTFVTKITFAWILIL